MFFDTWMGLLRVVLVGVPAYAALIVLLRTSGKRTLSKMNAFDLVITVALGSAFANVVLSKDVALLEGVVAFALLIGLQYLIAHSFSRSEVMKRIVKGEPTLLFHRGTFVRTAMQKERVIEEEIRAAIRAQGISNMEDVGAVVLETDGTFTVLPENKGAELSALGHLRTNA